jgi:hypothetical protein
MQVGMHEPFRIGPGHFQARHLLTFGWIALAVAMYFSCKHIDLLISFRSAAWMRIWQ